MNLLFGGVRKLLLVDSLQNLGITKSSTIILVVSYKFIDFNSMA